MSELVYARVELRTKDGTSSVVEFEALSDIPLTGQVELDREQVEVTSGSFREFVGGPLRGRVQLSGYVTMATRVISPPAVAESDGSAPNG